MNEVKVTNYTRKFAEEAGLVDGGKDEDGCQLWIGSDKQWNRFEKLKETYSEVQFNEQDKEWPYK